MVDPKCKMTFKEDISRQKGKPNNGNGLPCRQRGIQTESPSTRDVGVQCDDADIFAETDWTTVTGTSDADEDGEEDSNFSLYTVQQSVRLPNGMLECLVCGEISKKELHLKSHMAMHYGPPVLCSKCGEMISHSDLLGQHSYSCMGRPMADTRPPIYLKCPRINCDVIIRSKRQLRRHIHQHFRLNECYCHQCKKRFSSYVQFLVHCIRQSSCRRAKLFYLVRGPQKSSKSMSNRRCTLCERFFSTEFRCKRHKIKCTLKHYKRLHRLLCSHA